jgi:hypothetical protein
MVAALVGFAALAYAGLDDGKAAYDRGDYATAYKDFKPLAEQRDAEAQSERHGGTPELYSPRSVASTLE